MLRPTRSSLLVFNPTSIRERFPLSLSVFRSLKMAIGLPELQIISTSVTQSTTFLANPKLERVTLSHNGESTLND